MKAAWILTLWIAVAGVASAQLYKWVDKDGKVHYGDAPPPGAKSSPIAAPAPAADPAAGSKEAQKKPLTTAEREQEYRKQQLEAKKNADKADRERKAEADQAANCERTREALRTLASGQRMARTDAKGERYFLTDEQVAAETAQAQKALESCK